MKKTLLSVMIVSSQLHADISDIHYLAEAVYFEARSEPKVCQVILAQSIMNRVSQSRYHNNVRDVVHQKSWSTKHSKYVCQYSYYCDGNPEVMKDRKAEQLSYQIASQVLSKSMMDFSEGADHFYAHNTVQPEWGSLLQNPFVCSNHTFGKLDW